MKKYVSSTELARHLGITERTVSTYIKAGKLPQPKKSGRTYRHDLGKVYSAIVEHDLKCDSQAFVKAKQSLSPISLDEFADHLDRVADIIQRTDEPSKMIAMICDALPDDMAEAFVDGLKKGISE